MLKVNLRDGRTLCFDLYTDEGLAQWRESQAAPGFQRQITGVAIQQDRWTHTLPLPSKFRSVEFDAERIITTRILGAVVNCTADDVIISLTVYNSGVSRVDVRRREWRQRFAPNKMSG